MKTISRFRPWIHQKLSPNAVLRIRFRITGKASKHYIIALHFLERFHSFNLSYKTKDHNYLL